MNPISENVFNYPNLIVTEEPSPKLCPVSEQIKYHKPQGFGENNKDDENFRTELSFQLAHHYLEHVKRLRPQCHYDQHIKDEKLFILFTFYVWQKEGGKGLSTLKNAIREAQIQPDVKLMRLELIEKSPCHSLFS